MDLDPHPGHRSRHGISRVLHQRPHRGPARRCGRPGGPQGQGRHKGDGRPWFYARKEASGRRRTR
jgi:hypothetical protein